MVISESALCVTVNDSRWVSSRTPVQHKGSNTVGRDISSQTAALLSLEEASPLFRNAELATAFAQYCLNTQMNLLRGLLGGDSISVKKVWEDDGDVVDRGIIGDRLRKVRSGQDLHRLLGELTYACQEGEVGKYGHTCIKSLDGLVRLWNLYIKAWKHYAGVDMPDLASVETFGSGRNCGWAVSEFGHPYLAFSAEDTFKYVLTEKGRALQKALGKEITAITWTSVSE